VGRNLERIGRGLLTLNGKWPVQNNIKRDEKSARGEAENGEKSEGMRGRGREVREKRGLAGENLAFSARQVTSDKSVAYPLLGVQDKISPLHTLKRLLICQRSLFVATCS
jgi:hypothetical protein